MKTLRKWGAVGALTAAAAFPVLALSGAASAAPGGNSAASHACQKGGYATLQGTDGTLFSNVDACVSFAAQGGTLEPIPTPSVSAATAQDAFDPALCFVFITVSHFAPNTTYPTTISDSGLPPIAGESITTDANGNYASVNGNTFSPLGMVPGFPTPIVVVTVNGVSSPPTAPAPC